MISLSILLWQSSNANNLQFLKYIRWSLLLSATANFQIALASSLHYFCFESHVHQSFGGYYVDLAAGAVYAVDFCCWICILPVGSPLLAWRVFWYFAWEMKCWCSVFRSLDDLKFTDLSISLCRSHLSRAQFWDVLLGSSRVRTSFKLWRLLMINSGDG